VLAFAGCDGVGTSPDKIESDTTGTNAFRPSPRDSSKISESLKRVEPGGTLTISAAEVAKKPNDPQGDGPLRFDSVSVENTELEVLDTTLANQGETMVLAAPDSTGSLDIRFRPAYGEFVSDEMGTLPVTIQKGNQAPAVEADRDTTTAGQPVTTDVLTNDSDPDGEIDASTVQIESSPSNGSASVDDGGTITYEPEADFNGTDSYTYTVADKEEARSDEATVTIEVESDNQAPQITSGGSATTAENDTSTGYTATAKDTDGDTVTFSLSGGDDRSEFKINEQNGMLSFKSTPNFESPGDMDKHNDYEVKIQAADGKGGTDTQPVTVTVTDSNDVPMVVNKGLTVTKNDSVSIPTDSLKASDEDMDHRPLDLKFKVKEEPDNGELYKKETELSEDDIFTQEDLLNQKMAYEHDASDVEDDTLKFDLTDPAGAGPAIQTFPIKVIKDN
jgi:hypothetical protein